MNNGFCVRKLLFAYFTNFFLLTEESEARNIKACGVCVRNGKNCLVTKYNFGHVFDLKYAIYECGIGKNNISFDVALLLCLFHFCMIIYYIFFYSYT